jgi:hypothetical protein
MTSMLLPRLAIFSWTEVLAPRPMPTMAMTAATPMMIPRIVSSERIAFRRKARQAILNVHRQVSWPAPVVASSTMIARGLSKPYAGAKGPAAGEPYSGAAL